MLKYKGKLVEAIAEEIFLRHTFLENEKVETVYFGGGTPSLLDKDELNCLLDALHKHFDLSDVKEFTLEANPDDLSDEKLSLLKNSPINRLSIGVQSFFDEHLQLMNRAHKGAEALHAIKRARDFGFEQLSIDLIYGIPGLTDAQWEQNMQTIFDLGVNHVSSYCLTVEPKTAMAAMIEKNKMKAVDELQAERQFKMLIKAMQHHGFEHYEISNFAKPGHYALHNTNYWRGIPYLGLGPGAHSFKGNERSWNVSNNNLYMEAVEKAEPMTEYEVLSDKERFNEYVMTSLRTQWGCDRNHVGKTFGSSYLQHLDKELQAYVEKGLVSLANNVFTLTNEGKFFADGIAAAAFLV